MSADLIKAEIFANYPKKNFYLCGLGSLCILIALLVIIGWYAHKPFLIQLYPTFVPMQFNTALCFIISGLGLISACAGKKYLTISLGYLVGLFALLTLAQYLLNTDLKIDTLFIKPYITTQTSHPGRMSPVTAISFILVGISLFCISNPTHSFYRMAAWLSSVSVWAFSLTILFGYISQLEISYGWRDVTKMALHTALCFFLLGIGLILKAWDNIKYDGTLKNEGLILIGVILSGLIISVGFWQAQLAYSESNLQNTVYLETQHTHDIIIASINERMLSIDRMANRWNKRGGTPQSEWENDAANYISDFDSVKAIIWVDRSYHVRWVMPLQKNKSILNQTLSSEKHIRQTLDNAREQSSMMLTKTFDSDQTKVFNVVSPVFRNGEFDGFIIGVFQLQQMINRIFMSKAVQGLDLVLYEDEKEIFRSSKSNSGYISWSQETPFSLYDVNWRVQIIPKKQFTDRLNSRLPRTVLFTGLFITTLLAITTHLAQQARKRAVEAEKINQQLIKADQQLRYDALVIESSGEAVLSITPDGIITSWNKGALRIYGYTAEEAIGQHISIMFPSSKSDDFEKLSVRIKQGSTIENYETRRVRKDGQVILISLSLSPIKNADGELIGLSSISRDITKRKQMEAALQKNEATLNELFESSPDAILLVNREGNIVRANAKANELFGYLTFDLIGKNIETLLPSRYRTAHVEHKNAYIQSPHTRQMGVGLDLFAIRDDGTEFPVDVKLSPMQVNTEQFVIATVRDITERKEVEAQFQSSLKEKTLLLKEIHHRVKNNLQIVVSLLLMQTDFVKDKQVLQLVSESSNRVRSMALIHELLYQDENLADIEMQKYIFELTSHLFHTYGVDPRNVRCKIKTSDIRLDVDTAVPCGLILNELISNSLKYAFPNKTKGEISVQMRRNGQGKLTLAVSDNGVGLPPDFDLTKLNTLGLRLVRNLIRQLKGDLTIEREHGVRFVISFDYN